VRAERDELESRLSRSSVHLTKSESELASRTEQLSSALRSKAEEAASVTARYHKERKEKVRSR
jgi:hypothetical protein